MKLQTTNNSCCTPNSRFASLANLEDLFPQSFAGLSVFNPLLGLGRFLAPSEPRLAMDLYEDEGNYYARLEVPGVKREDISLELVSRQLTVKVTRKQPAAEGEGEHSLTLSRSLPLPENAQGDAISAKLADGFLTLTVPKAEEAKPRSIEIA
jgi:HSP20 family protein